jgi:hypothetical protein
VKLITLLAAATAAAVLAGAARANGDPASDVLPFTTVFLSNQRPSALPSGQDLLQLTQAAEKKKYPIRVAVIYQPSDLGLIQSLWKQPQPYANFLGKELNSFGNYHGTLVVAMPNGFGLYGPAATPAGKRAIAGVPVAGNGSVDELGAGAVKAVERVAAANGHALPAPKAHGSGTPSWLIALIALAGAAVVAGAIFFALRRWLTHA